eukprot:XP_011418997.1 PREDICTED: uncharacterized protein LOC105322155 [Crassostrea gigas]
MMASHKHSRRQLPSLSVEIADKQRHSLISHMTYKSSLEYLLKNEGTFTKALELIKRYPTLADHRSTAKIWEILSLGTKSCSEKPHTSWNGQAEKPKLPNMPTISISSDGSSDVQCASCTRHEKMHIGIVGISFEHTETLKWSQLVCNLSSEAFVHCLKLKSTTDVGLEVESVNGLVFVMSNSSLNNGLFLQAINYAQQHEIPVLYIREPRFKLPVHVSGDFTEKVLLQQGIQQQLSKAPFDHPSSPTSTRSALPPISKSGYYYHPNLEITGSSSTTECLESGYKEAIVFSGNNTDYCVQVIIKTISQSQKSRRGITPTNSDSEEFGTTLKPPTIDNFINSATSSKRQNYAQKGLFAEAVFDSSSSTESDESVVEVSPAKRDLDREESLDQETIYVLFPDRSEGSSGTKPVLVKWPPRENEVHTDTSLTDMDSESFLSDSSIGFQDVDLAEIMSDDDFIFT